MDATEGRATGDDRPLAPRVADRTNVLLLSPAGDQAGMKVHADLLAVEPLEREDVLLVTLEGSPDDRLLEWRSNVSHQAPARMGMVSVNDSVRSATEATGATSGIRHPIDTLSLATVPSATDLAGIGLTVSDYLSDWHGDGNRIVVCFDSLTPIVDQVPPELAFRFIHTLTAQFRRVDALAHFHLDPDAHDEATVKTLLPLFDAVIEVDDESPATVTRR